MTFREYFRLNTSTFKFCIKLCGIIFTVIAAIISIAIELTKDTNENPFLIFISCVLFGNLLGVFIAILGLISGYYQAQNLRKIINNLPQQIINDLSLKLKTVNDDSRFNFLNFKISGENTNSAIWIDYFQPKKEVWFGLLINITDFEDFKKRFNSINKSYRKSKIQLTGFGIVKTLKLNKWNRLNDKQIFEIIEELKQIAKNEHLEIKK